MRLCDIVVRKFHLDRQNKLYHSCHHQTEFSFHTQREIVNIYTDKH